MFIFVQRFARAGAGWSSTLGFILSSSRKVWREHRGRGTGISPRQKLEVFCQAWPDIIHTLAARVMRPFRDLSMAVLTSRYEEID